MLQATARLAMESGSTQSGFDRAQAYMPTNGVYKELSGAAYRQAFKTLSLRWHPDKFQAKFGNLLPEEDEEAIMQRVCSVFQCVSSQWQSYLKAGNT